MTQIFNNNLIFDVGFNSGQDTKLYLEMGYNVIGVDADPEMIKNGLNNYQKEILEGRLILLNIGISDKITDSIFYINKKNEFSSFSKYWGYRNTWGGEFEYSINVKTTTLSELITEYGIPYYIKIDIEGYDSISLNSLHYNNKPKYISLEYNTDIEEYDSIPFNNLCNDNNTISLEYDKDKEDDIINKLNKLGYTKFKLSHQQPIKKYNGVELEFGSSGNFGENLDNNWLNFDEIKELITIEYCKYDSTTWWCDIHATF